MNHLKKIIKVIYQQSGELKIQKDTKTPQKMKTTYNFIS